MSRDLSNSVVVEQVPCDSLVAHPRKLRKYKANALGHVIAALEKFEQYPPLLIDRSSTIIDGEIYHAAALALGWSTINVIRISNLTATQLRQYRLFLEKVKDLSEWDQEALKLEFQELSLENPDIQIDLPGFDPPEIDFYLSDGHQDQSVNEAEDIPPRGSDAHSVCRPGDIWHLGIHRLHVGDARDQCSYTALMGSGVAQLVLTDPPYNVPIDGHVSGLGSIRHAEFVHASGDLSYEGFIEFLRIYLLCCLKFCVDGALLYVYMDWRHMEELTQAAKAAGLTLINLCVWAKTNAGMGSLYRSQHELVFVFKYGSKPHINNIQLGKYGRNRTNVWTYPGMNSFHSERDELLSAHPTVKPVGMIADAILDCTNRGDIVLDPFAGSGTIFLAAERTGRRAYGIEIDPAYCEVAMDRWEKKTGQKAIHAETGLTREELLEERPPARQRSRPKRRTPNREVS